MNRISALYNVVSHNLLFNTSTMDYDRLTQAITRLANTLADTETSEDTWWLGDDLPLSDLITGAYWHYTEWHAGQCSMSYAALSALGRIYSPNMAVPDLDNIAFQILDEMAKGE